MSDLSIALMCGTAVLWIASKTYTNVKTITAKLYEKTVADVDNNSLPPSPYGLVRSKNYKGELGFSITKNGVILKVIDTENTYDVYYCMESAIAIMNKFEKMEGFRLTRI